MHKAVWGFGFPNRFSWGFSYSGMWCWMAGFGFSQISKECCSSIIKNDFLNPPSTLENEGLYLWGTGFESPRHHRLLWLRFCVRFLVHSQLIPACYLLLFFSTVSFQIPWKFVTDIQQTNKSQTMAVYRGADKSLARPGRKQATATEDFDVCISYL